MIEIKTNYKIWLKVSVFIIYQTSRRLFFANPMFRALATAFSCRPFPFFFVPPQFSWSWIGSSRCHSIFKLNCVLTALNMIKSHQTRGRICVYKEIGDLPQFLEDRIPTVICPYFSESCESKVKCEPPLFVRYHYRSLLLWNI